MENTNFISHHIIVKNKKEKKKKIELSFISVFVVMQLYNHNTTIV